MKVDRPWPDSASCFMRSTRGRAGLLVGEVIDPAGRELDVDGVGLDVERENAVLSVCGRRSAAYIS